MVSQGNNKRNICPPCFVLDKRHTVGPSTKNGTRDGETFGCFFRPNTIQGN